MHIYICNFGCMAVTNMVIRHTLTDEDLSYTDEEYTCFLRPEMVSSPLCCGVNCETCSRVDQ